MKPKKGDMLVVKESFKLYKNGKYINMATGTVFLIVESIEERDFIFCNTLVNGDGMVISERLDRLDRFFTHIVSTI